MSEPNRCPHVTLDSPRSRCSQCSAAEYREATGSVACLLSGLLPSTYGDDLRGGDPDALPAGAVHEWLTQSAIGGGYGFLA